jgi:putative peptidoglycan lipid II flippase
MGMATGAGGDPALGGGVLAFGQPLIGWCSSTASSRPRLPPKASRALLLYLPGLPFNAIDLPLVFAFYARKTPSRPGEIVGIISVIGLISGRGRSCLCGRLGFLGLVAANSAQAISHALIMLVLFARRYHGLRGYGVIRTSAAALAASVGVALLGYGSCAFVAHLLPGGLVEEAVAVLVGMGLAVGGYVALARRLGIREIDQVFGMVARRLGRGAA